MATVIGAVTKSHTFSGESFAIQWTPVTAADTCDVIEVPAGAKVSVQVAGTFDSATVVLQGSNDGTNYVGLTDPQGNAISKAAAAIEAVEEPVRYIKATHSGGGGSQSLKITLYVGRS